MNVINKDKSVGALCGCILTWMSENSPFKTRDVIEAFDMQEGTASRIVCDMVYWRMITKEKRSLYIINSHANAQSRIVNELRHEKEGI